MLQMTLHFQKKWYNRVKEGEGYAAQWSQEIDSEGIWQRSRCERIGELFSVNTSSIYRSLKRRDETGSYKTQALWGWLPKHSGTDRQTTRDDLSWGDWDSESLCQYGHSMAVSAKAGMSPQEEISPRQRAGASPRCGANEERVAEPYIWIQRLYALILKLL